MRLITASRRAAASFSLNISGALVMTEPELPVIVRFDPDSNEPELVKFYTALGMCVSSWAFIDRWLYEIFHGALGMGARQSALIYYRQRAFNQRLRLVDD